ncbi:TniQ family protein [Streptomyces abikoensis]|uniref:TniQ family protein n=1 Tax=Streptomyces abikoensis TaxID=97398 RepID=UPI0033D4F524
MTRWADERIPIWVPPVVGEALDSWLEAYAHRLKTVTLDFVDFLGLPGTSLPKMVCRLTEGERDVLTRRTGLGCEQLTAMTLEPFNDSVVRIHPDTRRMLRPLAWRHYSTTSRYCPVCLGEGGGRWQLGWRLSWAFACRRHRLLLLDCCPRCGYHPPVASLGRHRVVPQPQTCRAWVRGPAVRCGYPLPQASAVPLPAHGPVLAAQCEVDRAVLAEHRSAAARKRAGELHFLARRALRGIHARLDAAPAAVHEVLTECGGTLPALAPGAKQEASDAHNVAIGTTVAAIATDLTHPACQEVFTWLVGTPGRPRAVQRDHPASNLGNWAPAGPRVAARILAASDGQLTLNARLRYGSATTTPARPTLTEQDTRRRAAKLPAMLWASWTLRLLPPKSPHQARIPGIRRACATLMLIPGTSNGQYLAARLLGNSQSRSSVDALLSFIDADHVAGSLPYLARVLDQHEVPIDYARRRALFTDETRELPIDEDSYRQICRRHGSRNFQTVHLERARWHLRRLLLGADPGSGNHAPSWSHRWAYRMHPDIGAFLRDQATRILTTHGIDEPVTFEPPEHWLDGLPLLVAPLGSPHERLRSVLRAGPTQAKAAKILGLTIHQLRLLLESRSLSAPAPPPPPKPKGRYQYPRQGPLAPDRLRDLYQRQGLQQKQIAELAGCTPGVVRYALDQAGIPLRPRRAAGELERTVSRAWLKAEYQDKGRNAADIADELSVASSDIFKLLGKRGIPHHPKGHPRTRRHPSPFAALDVELSPAMARVSELRNCLRMLRHIVALPGMPDRASTAEYFGMARTSLRGEIYKVEAAAGFDLLVPWRRPLRATPEGQELIDEARRLLQRLDAPAAP